jgi:hypothetical protein
MNERFKLKGKFVVECFDKLGNLKWKEAISNLVVNEGLDLSLDIIFGVTAKPTWYVGLIRDDNYTGIVAGDTMASHGGWEEADEYSESTRPTITFGTASGQETSNGTPIYFSCNATETMKGAFLTTNNTKSGTAGKLWCAALSDGGDQVVNNGDVVKVMYYAASSAS